MPVYQPMPHIENKITVHLTRSEALHTIETLKAHRKTYGSNIVDKPDIALSNQRAMRAVETAIKDHDHAALVAEAMRDIRRLNKKPDATQVYVLLMSFCALGVLIGAVLMWWV